MIQSTISSIEAGRVPGECKVMPLRPATSIICNNLDHNIHCWDRKDIHNTAKSPLA